MGRSLENKEVNPVYWAVANPSAVSMHKNGGIACKAGGGWRTAVFGTPIPGQGAKGTITSMNCDPATNGFQLTETYVVGQGGQELSMLSSSGTTTSWQRTNVYGAGRQLATYESAGGQTALHFQVLDPLGTRRLQTDANGTPETACQSLPYGGAGDPTGVMDRGRWPGQQP